MNVYRTQKSRDLVYQAYDETLALWDVEFTERDVETSYGKTHLIIAGKEENPPLILLHGAADNSVGMWRENIKGLSERYYCIAVDTLGAAGKSVPDEGYGKGFQLSKWFCDILDELKITKTNLCGVSYGSELSLHFAVKCPDRVLKYIGIAGCPPTQGYNQDNGKRALKLVLPAVLFPTNKNFMKLLKKYCGNDFDMGKVPPEPIRLFMLLVRKYNPMSQRFHDRITFSADQIREVKNKSLYLLGDQDRLIYYPESLRVFKELELNLRIFKGAGHMLNMEQPEEVNKAIIEFLSANS